MKKITLPTSLLVLSIVLTPVVLAYNELKTELNLPTDKVTILNIDAGAGDLVVKGDDDAQEISVRARIRPADASERDYTLTLEQSDGEALLYAHIEPQMFQNSYIDLEVTVPSGLKLDIKDRSGDLEVSNVLQGLTINDRSGDIKLKGIAGGIKLRDRSGDIAMRTITGDVEIVDRSGDVDIITLTGNLSIDDRSGDITIVTVAGNVEVQDGSGDIEVSDVSGKVGVEDGSGDISIDGAESFVLYQDGKGDVDLVNVKR